MNNKISHILNDAKSRVTEQEPPEETRQFLPWNG